MRLVIFTVLVISLATIVIKAEGSRLIIEEKSRMLQKQSSFGKEFLTSFFGSKSQGAQADKRQDNADQQYLENNLDQLAKALPYQMLLPRRKNSIGSPLGLLGNLFTPKNQQKTLLDDEQINPLEELNQLLSSRKKKSEKKPFHWENPDFKENKKDIPIYKIFGSKSKKNHRLQISEEQVQNILANQIPAFRDGRLLKLSETAYSKGFFLNVEYLTKKNQVYKVKAKYNQQDNQLQIISMSQLINFEEPEEQLQSNLNQEEEEEKFIIEEILNQQQSQEESEVVQQIIEKDLQSIIQKSVQQPIQIKQSEASLVGDNIKQKATSKNEGKTPLNAQQIKLQTIKETIKQLPLKQQNHNIVQPKKVEKILQKIDKQVKLPTPSIQENKKVEIEKQPQEKQMADKGVVKEQPKQKQPVKEIKKEDAKIQPKKQQPIQQVKKEESKENKAQKQPVKQQKKAQKVQKQAEKKPSNPQQVKKEESKENKVQKQPVKQQKKAQKVQKQAEKKPTNLVKQKQKEVDIPSLNNLQKQGKNLAKQQPKPLAKSSSDKPADNRIIVQN